MKDIENLEHFAEFSADDVDLTIRRSKRKEEVCNQALQVNIRRTSTRHKEFLDFFRDRCDGRINLDVLDVSKNWSRTRTDKPYEEIRDMIGQNSITGIKINHNPYIRIHEWEEWEDGFLECFTTTMAKMDVLREILEEFGGDMAYSYVPIWGDFARGEKVSFNGKTYDYGYMGQTGKAIIYEEGERNMQDAIAVDPKALEPA